MVVHHWAQGPMDVRPAVPFHIDADRIAFWVFNYYIETPWIQGVPDYHVAVKVDFVLNLAPLAWSRTGVYFCRVHRPGDAQIVLRFSDAPLVGWPELPWGPGWYYHDAVIGKNVAQITAKPEYFNHTPSFNYYLNMELVGHGCFRMWDMYIKEHEPYLEGVMGGLEAAMVNNGFPSNAEIEAAMLWLQGKAPLVHDHAEFTVPSAGEADATV